MERQALKKEKDPRARAAEKTRKRIAELKEKSDH